METAVQIDREVTGLDRRRKSTERRSEEEIGGANRSSGSQRSKSRRESSGRGRERLDGPARRRIQLKIEKDFHWCPKFNNLTILTLGEWCLCADFYALVVFLQNSPNLMKLILKVRKKPDTHEMFIGELEERYFTCEHLKIVEIVRPGNLEHDHMLNDLEKFLVGNGIRSDQIEIKNWKL